MPLVRQGSSTFCMCRQDSALRTTAVISSRKQAATCAAHHKGGGQHRAGRPLGISEGPGSVKTAEGAQLRPREWRYWAGLEQVAGGEHREGCTAESSTGG